MTVILEIPNNILASARLSVEDLRLELALSLYAARRLSIGKARELAELSLWQFRQIAAARGISADIDIREFDEEIAELTHLGRL